MNCRCPNCGAVYSLDALLANDDAREALRAISELGGDFAKLVVRYCGLFRPAQSQLTFARLAKLINELLPAIKAQRIERGGRVYDAPPAAWAWAITQMLDIRDANKLETPLKSHGYLYEVISKYRPESTLCPIDKPASQPVSIDQGLAGINKYRR